MMWRGIAVTLFVLKELSYCLHIHVVRMLQDNHFVYHKRHTLPMELINPFYISTVSRLVGEINTFNIVGKQILHTPARTTMLF